ncbi:MAG: hypothetical protein GXO79_12360 [Chlorobi bacterium]|nr:hypothetical protein [Chlorobiota bacterium]
MTTNRKYYPGDPRKLGEKEYAVILSKLINYANQLTKDNKTEILVGFYNKIIVKLKELGFKKESTKVKNLGKSESIFLKNRLKIAEIALNSWDIGTKKHKLAKTKKKEKENV